MGQYSCKIKNKINKKCAYIFPSVGCLVCSIDICLKKKVFSLSNVISLGRRLADSLFTSEEQKKFARVVFDTSFFFFFFFFIFLFVVVVVVFSNLISSGHSLVGSLLTNEEQNKVGS